MAKIPDFKVTYNGSDLTSFMTPAGIEKTMAAVERTLAREVTYTIRLDIVGDWQPTTVAMPRRQSRRKAGVKPAVRRVERWGHRRFPGNRR
jgi:hypothetical protein